MMLCCNKDIGVSHVFCANRGSGVGEKSWESSKALSLQFIRYNYLIHNKVIRWTRKDGMLKHLQTGEQI